MFVTKKFTAAALALAATMLLGVAASADTASSAYDQQIQAKLAAQLEKKSEFKDIHSSVADGIVTLNGTTDSLRHKLDAENKARKQEHVAGVRDQVAVAGPQVADAELTKKLASRLAHDRVNQGSVFNFLTVSVANGVATVGGEVRTPADKASALDEVISTKGVKGVVDRVSVAPPSPADDALRLRIARAIYRDPVLSRYALDPQAPIRIVVDGGHVGLYGVVDSQLDRTIAGMRASQVFGSFGVENHLVTQSVAR